MGVKTAGFYDSTYQHFDDAIYQDIRRATWGEDMGQNGWITVPEQDQFIQWLSIIPGCEVLDVACGSGGPALRVAERTGARMTGVDIDADGIAAARRETGRRRLTHQAVFEVVDAGQPLRFAEKTFDAVMCIDAVNHLPDRAGIFAEWARVLKPGGRLLFTDPIVITGPLTNAEIAARSSIGFFLFVARETNDQMLARAGLRLIVKEDVTEAVALAASAWQAARQVREVELRRLEGEALYRANQEFLAVAARIARERRLSRFVYVAEKPD
ncbi:MAG: class I SAM-dependent methyltransferase [Phycisphaeraceae bacterium]|nr:class I SAM-dependent methyltransferase [Phycisphaeraceae bacterium]